MTLTKGQQWQKCGLYLQKIKKPYKLFFLEAYFLKIKTAVLPLLRRVFFWRLGILGNIFSLISVFLMSFPLSKKLKFQKNISQNPKVPKKNSPYPRAIRVSPFVRSLFPYARFVVQGSFFEGCQWDGRDYGTFDSFVILYLGSTFARAFSRRSDLWDLKILLREFLFTPFFPAFISSGLILDCWGSPGNLQEEKNEISF